MLEAPQHVGRTRHRLMVPVRHQVLIVYRQQMHAGLPASGASHRAAQGPVLETVPVVSAGPIHLQTSFGVGRP